MQIQLCTLIYCLQYEFFQSSFEMPGINYLIFYLSLSQMLKAFNGLIPSSLQCHHVLFLYRKNCVSFFSSP